MKPASLLLLLGLVGCAPSILQYSTRHEQLGVQVRVRVWQEEEAVRFLVFAEGRSLGEVMLIRADGTSVSPDRPDENKSHQRVEVRFRRGDLGPGPWRLDVVVDNRPPIPVLIADVRHEEVGQGLEAFGYHREVWAFPDGGSRVVYVRADFSGVRKEVSWSEFEFRIRPALQRVAADLPKTREELDDCPEVAAFLADIMEAGATYRGEREGDNRHPHSKGTDFWVPPTEIAISTGEDGFSWVEDPLSTCVLLLLEGLNASQSTEVGEIYERARKGDSTEDQCVREEALWMSRGLLFAVDMIRRNKDTLRVDWHRSQGFGDVYTQYEEWVYGAGKDVERVADLILASPAVYTDNPDEKGETYQERLRRIYRGFSDTSD
jgi:hypothetical protein